MTDRAWSTRFAAIVAAVDLALINGSFFATSLLKFGTLYPADHFVPIYVKYQLFVNALLPLCLVLAGAYRDVARAPLGHQAVTAFKACVWAAAVTVAALFLVRDIGYSRVTITFHLAEVAVLIPFSRMLLERVNASARLRGHGVRRVLVAGERAPLADLALRLRMAPYLGYAVEAVWPFGFEPGADPEHGPALVRDLAGAKSLLASGRIDRIFIAARDASPARLGPGQGLLDLAEQYQVEARLVRWPLVVPDLRARIHEPPSLLLSGAPAQPSGSWLLIKRALDLVLGGLLTLLLAPAWLIIALALKLDSPGPVFYRQLRLGRWGRPFRIFKFRSMHTLAEEERARLGDENEATGPLFKMRKDPRVTRVGAWLRRFSLDELPQLFNVLAGHLSLVGPRPPLPEEVERYEPWQRRRLDVPQGMTGLWQVSGRSRLSFEEMALLDLYYVEHGSILLDLEILLETLPTVVHGDGAY